MEEDFERFYEREFRRVFQATSLMCGNEHAAQDAAQEAFARALARWKRLKGQTWAGGWVTTTALNLARRALRRRPIPLHREQEMRDVDGWLDIREAVTDLPDRQREAIALYYLLDLPIDRIASNMGCRASTVRVHLARGRAALFKVLGGVPLED